MLRYTTLEEVKRRIKTARSDRVRFSDVGAIISVEIVDATNRPNITPGIQFNHRDVVFDTAFDRERFYTINMTSATDFEVWESNPNTRSQTLFVGTGDVATDFEVIDEFTIPAGTISGPFTAGMSIKLSLSAHLSDESAEIYIEDAEVMVDSYLKSREIYADYGLGNVSNFETPDELRVAATLLACYDIYVSVFPMKKTDSCCSGFLDAWKKRAEQLLENFADTALSQETGRPGFIAFPTKMDRFGVPGVGPGVEGSFNQDNIPTTRNTGLNQLYGGESDES